MPISLELVNFTEAFRIHHVKLLAESFQRLGDWLAKRVKAAEDLDRKTAHIPRVWFHGNAIRAWIDSSQKSALAPNEKPPRFRDQLRSGWRRLLAGLDDIHMLKRESEIIPNFFGPLVAAVEIIEKSVDKFMTPTKEMFNTGERKASDIFGEAALAWRALYFSKGQLMAFTDTLKELKGPDKPGGAARVESVAALGDMFERATRFIVAGLILIPRLPEFVKAVWGVASLFIRGKVLQIFAGLEQKVYAVRRKIIDIFQVRLREKLRRGLALAHAFNSIMSAWIVLFLDLGSSFTRETVSKLRYFLSRLGLFMNRAVGLFRGLESLLEALTMINLMPWLLSKQEWYIKLAAEQLGDPPVITLDDLGTAEKRTDANARMQGWLTQIARNAKTAAAIAGGVLAGKALESYLNSKLAPVREVLTILFTTKTKEVGETTAFAGPVPEFPNIYDAFAQGADELRQALVGFWPTLGGLTMDLISKGEEALTAVGDRFERMAEAALLGPSTAKLLAISEKAEEWAGKILPSSDVEGGEPSAVLSAIARSWEEWFFADKQGGLSGFALLGTIIPQYIDAMRKYWDDRLARGEEATVRLPDDLPKDFPTSQHIMLLNPALARTLVPRMKIVAKGQPLDESLADHLAGAFLDLVQEAHRRGLSKLAKLQAEADAVYA